MKKLIILFALTGALIMGLAFYISKNLEPRLKALIETHGTEKFGGPVSVSDLSIQYFPPGLKLNQLSAQRKGLDISVRSVVLTPHLVGLLSKKLKAEVALFDPNIQYEAKTMESKGNVPQPKTESANLSESLQQARAQFDFDLLLKVQNGTILINQDNEKIKISGADIQLQAPGWQNDWNLAVMMDIFIKNQKIPLYVDSRFRINTEDIQFHESNLRFLGLTSTLSGNIKLNDLSREFLINADIANVATLNIPDQPFGKLESGGFVVNARYVSNPKMPLSVQAKIKTTDLKGKVNWSDDKLNAKGNFAVSSDINFEINNGRYKVPKLFVTMDLSDLIIQYGDIFNKAQGVVFKGNIQSEQLAEADLNIRNFAVVLDKLQMSSSGLLGLQPGRVSRISFQISPVQLQGFEKLIPLLAQSPLKGELEAKGELAGDIQAPDKMSLKLSPLRLTGFEANANWKSKDGKTSLSGPVFANLLAVIESVGSELKSANISANVNMNQLSISNPQFAKTNKDNFELLVKAQQFGGKIKLETAQLKMPAGMLSITGTVAQPTQPVLDLKYTVQQLDIQKMATMMPKLQLFKPRGQLTSSGNIFGKYDFKLGIEKSPLKLKSSSQFKISYVEMKSEKPTSNQEAKSNASKNDVGDLPEPMVPSWNLTRDMSVDFQGTIDEFLFNDLKIKKISTKGSVQSGVLKAQSVVGDIFGGSLNITALQMNLLVPQPTTLLDAQAKAVKIESVLPWMSAEWKDLAKGSTDGKVKASISHKTRKDFLDTTTAEGDFKVKNGFLNTTAFDQIINKKISSIPGLGSRQDLQVKTGGVNADMDGIFKYAKSELQLVKFDAITPQKDELKSKGIVRLDKTMDLEATAYLTNPPVGGSIREANSDASGRMVVPVKLKGSVFSPDVDVAAETVSLLLKKAGELELKKASSQLQKSLGSEGQKLKEEAEKRLKQLFGK